MEILRWEVFESLNFWQNHGNHGWKSRKKGHWNRRKLPTKPLLRSGPFRLRQNRLCWALGSRCGRGSRRGRRGSRLGGQQVLNDGEEGSSGFFHLTLLKPWENKYLGECGVWKNRWSDVGSEDVKNQIGCFLRNPSFHTNNDCCWVVKPLRGAPLGQHQAIGDPMDLRMTSWFPEIMNSLHHQNAHRIHGAAIYGDMDPINIPPLC